MGLCLALRLRQTGRSVLVLERATPGTGASRAAAGMLAVHDQANPPQITALAERSMALYPGFLAQLATLGAEPVPFETDWTLEWSGKNSEAVQAEAVLSELSPQAGLFHLHHEHSLDPRKLFASLLTATERSGTTLGERQSVEAAIEDGESVRVLLDSGAEILCNDFVDCTGAWSVQYALPIKGQMLRLQLPQGALYLPGKGNVVVRTPEVYLVPRLDGTCLVGATIEHAGFDTAVRRDATDWLRTKAVELLPALADAPEIESWCGLRPGTADTLPVLGAISKHRFVATGLYRNGILLAPAVAEALHSLVQGEQPAANLSEFQPRLRKNGPDQTL